MNCRFRNVALLLIVLFCAGGLASAQSNSRSPQIPALYAGNGNPLIQPWNVRAEFEGPNTADFFNTINNPASPNASLLANPQIAVGPEDMLLVANSQIWRLPNGNAPGVIPTGLYPGNQLIGGQAFGAQRVSLDNWIGATALAQLCPTGNTDASGTIDAGNTRSAVTCQIDNATATYDQMHGRFLVLFTVVDTGMTFSSNAQTFVQTRPRKASWVLLVSRFAVLVDQACFQGTQTTGCTAQTNVPTPLGPNPAGSFAFQSPTASFGSQTGSVSDTLWRVVYGNDLTALGSDGFGSQSSSGTNAGWVGNVGVGNINSLPGILDAAGNGAVFGCNPADVAAPGAAPTKVCYLPTGARIGVDNDTVTLVSPVIDVNINGANFSATYNPPTAMPGYAGNRVRVIKKTALYTASATLTAANQFTNLPAATPGYYDLYSWNGLTAGSGTPLVNVPPTPYTAVLNNVDCAAGSNPSLANEDSINSATTTVRCRMTPVFYEPAHLRGRAQASFSGLMIPGTALTNTAQTYLVGTISSSAAQRSLYVQAVVETVVGTGLPGANFFGAVPFTPNFASSGFPEQVGLPSTFANPAAVSQANFRSGDIPGSTAAPNLLVGDDRPHNVIFREGYLYDARVITSNPTAINQANFPQGSSLSTTTKYEIVQKLCATPIAGVCPTATPLTTISTGEVLNSPILTVSATGRTIGEPVAGPGIPAGATIIALGTTTVTISANATATQTVTLSYGGANAFPGVLTYQQYWQNTNAYAPMFDVPANVVTFGVGTPYNALNFLEKLFVATTVPPLSGNADTGYNTAPAGTPAALMGDFGTGDPRTRITYGASGLTPTQLSSAANCYNNQLSPGGPIGGTANNPVAWASLFDTRCGVDATDSNPQVRDPYTGVIAAASAMYTVRGGEGIDPNDGSLWNFGAYAMKRDASVSALAHWGTFGANYKLSFPSTDVYGNSTILFSDVSAADAPFVQIAIINGLVPSVYNASGQAIAPPNSKPIPFAGVNGALYGSANGAFPIPAGSRAPGVAPPAGVFGLDDVVTRREMAYWIVRSIMDDAAIDLYLKFTASLNGVTGTGASASSFSDVPSTDPGWKYIEVMARKGYTSGCSAGVTRTYCPDYATTRRDLAAFMIRAKFGNVFQSSLSGCASSLPNGTTSPTPGLYPPAFTTSCNSGDTGDNFALFTTGLPYFTDNKAETGNVWYTFLQKMREMRITNGTFLGPANDGRNGLYSIGANALPPLSGAGSEGNLTRRQVLIFMVRGFFL
jgi:hypothetical protein